MKTFSEAMSVIREKEKITKERRAILSNLQHIERLVNKEVDLGKLESMRSDLYGISGLNPKQPVLIIVN